MRTYLLYTFLLMVMTVQAQNDRQSVREGNRQYHRQQWAQAEVEYRKALSNNSENPQALYNLGCALMMQQKDSAAIVQYQKAAQVEQNKLRRAKSFHNIGVICQNHKMYGDAIKAYEQSLRNNPHDDETRYNLALCKQLDKNNPQNKNDKNKNKEQKQDKQKQEQKEQNKDTEKDKQQEQKEQMSKENAEQLLNAAIQNEKATQQRMKKNMQQPRRRNIQKNW